MVLVQILFPVSILHFLAFLPQSVVMYLLFILGTNAQSILVPLHVPSGSFRATNVNGTAIVLHFVFIFLIPVLLAPALLPLGIEWSLAGQGWTENVPVCLLVSIVECAAVVYIYRMVLGWEGRWLHAREQAILKTVTSKTE